jgi:manganese/zinc/iron transport system substrate-binding protein
MKLPAKPTAACVGLALAAAWLGLGSGCRRAESHWKATPRYPLRVVCTTGMVADMLKNIGGQHVIVQAMMGPGVDPHLYKATPRDVRRLTSADVVFYSGLHLEGQLAELLEKLDRWKPTHAVTDGLRRSDPSSLRHMPGTEGVYDPHVWFNIALWARCAEYAAERLAAVDPDRADDYRRNAVDYVAQLKALDEKCRKRLAEIPRERRVLVTAHDAFGYFGEAYDVEVHGLQGLSTIAEADLASVNQIIDLLVARRVKAVFVESSVPIKNIRALVEGCAARGHKVAIGGELFSDALGLEGTREGTYLGMVEHNLKTIVEALK